jgi:predicted HAD superfamily phosphohydrolase YqeG
MIGGVRTVVFEVDNPLAKIPSEEDGKWRLKWVSDIKKWTRGSSVEEWVY